MESRVYKATGQDQTTNHVSEYDMRAALLHHLGSAHRAAGEAWTLTLHGERSCLIQRSVTSVVTYPVRT